MDRIELSDCAVRLEGGSILHLIWNAGTRIEAGNARAALDAINTVAGEETYPLLVEMAEVSFVSHDARSIFARPCAASRIALLGQGPVDRMLVDYQLTTAPVPCSAMFFTSRTEALAWLRDPEVLAPGQDPPGP